MHAVNISLTVPGDVYSTLRSSGIDRERIGEQARHLLALWLYRDGVLSLGKAAHLAGMCHADFQNWLATNNTVIVEYTPEDYKQDQAMVQQYLAENTATFVDSSQLA